MKLKECCYMDQLLLEFPLYKRFSIFFYKQHWKTIITQYLAPFLLCIRFYTIRPFKAILSAATRSDINVMLYNDDDDYVDEKNPLINKENCPRFWAWLPLVEAKEKLQLWKTFTSPSMSRSYCFTTHPIGKHLRLFAYRSFIPITLLRTFSCYCKCSSSLSAMSTPIQRLQRSSDAFWICINVKVLSCPWSLMSTADLGLSIRLKHNFIHKTEHPYAKLIHLCHHRRLRWTQKILVHKRHRMCQRRMPWKGCELCQVLYN